MPDTESPIPLCPKHDTSMIPHTFATDPIKLWRGLPSGFKCPNPECVLVYMLGGESKGFYSVAENGEFTPYLTAEH